MKYITVLELSAWITDINRPQPFLLDVREPWEYKKCHIPGAKLIPMHLISDNILQLNQQKQIICICHHGVRSMQIATFLESKGFVNIMNLVGGVHAWAIEIDQTMPQY